VCCFHIHLVAFHSSEINVCHPPSLLSSGYGGLLPWGYSGWGVKLTTHLHLVLRSRMSGAIPPLPNSPSRRGTQLKQKDNFTFYLYLLYARKTLRCITTHLFYVVIKVHEVRKQVILCVCILCVVCIHTSLAGHTPTLFLYLKKKAVEIGCTVSPKPTSSPYR
jgi:hypothetical protein